MHCGLAHMGLGEATELLALEMQNHAHSSPDRFLWIPNFYVSSYDCFSIVPEDSEVRSSWCSSFPTKPGFSPNFVSQGRWKLSLPEG